MLIILMLRQQTDNKAAWISALQPVRVKDNWRVVFVPTPVEICRKSEPDVSERQRDRLKCGQNEYHFDLIY